LFAPYATRRDSTTIIEFQDACDQGAEGFLSFLTYDLAAEVALCEQNQAYYLLASGTVSDEDFDAVADNPWFLGMFGPGEQLEYKAGLDMARYFVAQGAGDRYFILSGGAPLGNEMHYQRTLGILDAFSSAYGVAFPTTRAELAMAEKPITVETERVTVTICPGYVSGEAFFQTAKETFEAGEYDAVLSVLPPVDMIDVIGKTPLAVVDSYNTRNFQLFSGGAADQRLLLLGLDIPVHAEHNPVAVIICLTFLLEYFHAFFVFYEGSLVRFKQEKEQLQSLLQYHVVVLDQVIALLFQVLLLHPDVKIDGGRPVAVMAFKYHIVNLVDPFQLGKHVALKYNLVLIIRDHCSHNPISSILYHGI
jgi:hypothetical protein